MCSLLWVRYSTLSTDCLCGWESATYSSKLPLWRKYLLVRQLVGTWAKQRLALRMAQLHTACPQGRRPPAASPLRSPGGPVRLAALSLQPASGADSCTAALSLFHRFCVCVKTQVIHQFCICLKTQMIQITRKVNSGIELRKQLLLVRLGLLFNFQLNF